MKFRYLAMMFVLLAAACGTANTPTPAAMDVEITLQIAPDPPNVGASTLTITLRTTAGEPVDNAQLAVQGNMSHMGMMPVDGEASTSQNGIYTVPFEWTMGGEWVLTVTAELPNGQVVTEEFPISVGAVSDESIIHRTPTAEATAEATSDDD